MYSPSRDSEDRERQPTLIDPARALTSQLPARPLDGTAEGPGAPGPRGHDGAPPAQETVVAGRYRLLEQIGSGATAQVWTAMDEQLRRSVAVKLLHPDWRGHTEVAERFRREGLLTARLRHPGIVGVLDAGIDDGTAFHVMELVEGGTLRDLLNERGRLSVEETGGIVLAVLGALGHAHGQGLVHRDVKPSNVLVPGGGRSVQLTDFGVAKEGKGAPGLTATGVVLGTVAYLSPEQALGQPLDGRSDLFSLACVMFECLTGEQPFRGDSPLQVATARLTERVRVADRAAAIPESIDRFVARAMAPRPEDRYADASEMAAGLRAALDGAATREPVGEAGPSSPDRTILGVVLAMALVLIVVLAIVRPSTPDVPVTVDDAAPPPDSSGELLPIAAAEPFDPQGDGGDHASEIGLLIDGDPATAWRSEGYNSATFGNLKDGVGALLELAGEEGPAAVRLSGLPAGQRVELRVSVTRPAVITDTTLAGTAEGGEEVVEVALDDAARARWLTVWVVAPLPADGGRFRASIGEVQLVS